MAEENEKNTEDTFEEDINSIDVEGKPIAGSNDDMMGELKEFMVEDEEGGEKEEKEENETEEEEEKETKEGDEEETDENTNSTEDKGENQEEDEDTGNAPEEDEESPSAESLRSYASALREQGVLPNFDPENDKIETAEDLTSLVNKEIESSVEQYKNSVDDLTRDLIEAAEQGVPLDEYKESISRQQNVMGIKDEDLENDTDLQKNIIKREFLERGFSEDKAEKHAERSFDTGDNEEDAKDALKTIKETEEKKKEELKEKSKKDKERQEKEQKEKIENIKNKIDNTKEVIPGVKASNTLKDKAFKSMTTVVDKDENGNPMNAMMAERKKDPESFDTKLHLIYQLTDGFKDWSKVNKSAKTDATKELEETLSSSKNTGRKTSGKPKKGKGKGEAAPDDILRAAKNLNI